MFYGPAHFYDRPKGRPSGRAIATAKASEILAIADCHEGIAVIPKIADILEVVSFVSGVPVRDIIGPWRWQGFMVPRFAVYWIARHFTLQSYPQIARAMGNRNHATIISGVRRVEKYSKTYKPIIVTALEILEKRGFYMMVEVKFR